MSAADATAVPGAVARLLERVECEAQADQREGAPAAVREAVGLGARWFGDVLAVTARRGGPTRWNRVMGLGVGAPAGGALLDALRDHYAWNQGRFEINLAPFASPPGLVSDLGTRGFVTPAEEIKWCRDGSPASAVQTSLRVERAEVADADGAEQVLREAFGASDATNGWIRALIERPGWQVFVAREDQVVAATASVFTRGESAWFGIAATRPAWRRRGAQSALFAARIEAARAAGARWMTLETEDDTPARPNSSARNATRAGFRIAYRRTIWVPEAARSVSSGADS